MDEYMKKKEQQWKWKSWYLYGQNNLDETKTSLSVCQNLHPTRIPLGSVKLEERDRAEKEGIQPW